MKIKATLVIALLFCSHKANANVTLSFEDAMGSAQKIALITIQQTAERTIKVKVIQSFKGVFKNKVTLIGKVENFTVKKFQVGVSYFVLLDAKNAPYKSNYGCGEYNVIALKAGQVHKGIFRYPPNSYAKNDPNIQTIDHISKAIKRSIPKNEVGKVLPTQSNDQISVSRKSSLKKDAAPKSNGQVNGDRLLNSLDLFVLVFTAGFFIVWLFKRIATANDSTLSEQ